MRTSNRTSKSKKPERASRKIGDLLKAKRIEKNLSQSDLAKLLGYESPQYVSDWERAYSSVPMAKLPELSKHLGVDRDRVFEMLLDFARERLERQMRNEYRSIVGKKG